MKKLLAAFLLAPCLMAVCAQADDAALISETNAALARKDYSAAASALSALAQHGNASAQYSLGILYVNGLGVARDEKLAYDWFAQSAMHGNSNALNQVEKGAAQGNANARNALDRIHQGQAPADPAPADDRTLIAEANAAAARKDYGAAFRKFSILAQHGNVMAQYNVGVFYLSGMGVPKDEKLAFDWFGRSAAAGNARAREFLEKSAGQGNRYAQQALAQNDPSGAGSVPARQNADSYTARNQAAADGRGFYFGVGAGKTGKLNGVVNSTSVGALAGYRFTPKWGMELAYNALYRNAKADVLASSFVPGATGVFSMNAVSISAQYIHHVTGAFSLLGNLGVHHSSFDLKSAGIALQSGTSSGVVAGLKAQYDFGRHFGLRAGFDSYTQSGGMRGTLTEVGVNAIFMF